MEERISLLRQNPIFSSLPEDSLMKISEALNLINVPKGNIIFREGDPGNSMFLIRYGIVAILIYEKGRQKIVNQLGRGDFFGEMALLTETPRSATARALIDSTIYELPKEKFDKVLRSDPIIAIQLSRIISSRLKEIMSITSPKTVTTYYGVVGSEGKVGASSFIRNLSFYLSREARKKVLIISIGHSPEAYSDQGVPFNSRPPSKPLFRSFKEEYQRSLDQCWFEAEGQFSLFVIPILEDHEFEQVFIASLPYLFEIFRENFDIVLADLPYPFNPISYTILKLCDQVLFLISNTPEGLERAKDLLSSLMGIFKYDPTKIRVGISHLIGGKGIHRTQIKTILDLPEVPEIWMFKDEWPYKEAMEKPTRREMKKLIGSRKLARELGKVRIGLALGAGGARGWAHIGVLKVLEEEGIPIDMIAGSSIGALVGAIYSYTGSAKMTELLTIDNFSTAREFRKKIYDYTLPKTGIIKGRKFFDMLRATISDADFLDLKIPLYIVAVDLFSGKEVIFERGSVSKAVRASISIPGIFNPVIWDDRYLVDGGVANPVPVDVLIRKGADYIISVVIEKSQDREFMERTSPGILKILTRSFKVMSAKIAQANTIKSNVTIYPRVSDFQWDDFHLGKELVVRGEEAAREVIEEIRKFVFS